MIHPSEIASRILEAKCLPEEEDAPHGDDYVGCSCSNTRALARAYLDLLASVGNEERAA